MKLRTRFLQLKLKSQILLVCLVFILTACKKDEICDDPSLPCQTHEGKNTFGCLIDGVPFVASVKFTVGGPVAVSGSFDEESRLLLVQGNRGNDNGSIDAVRFMIEVNQGISVYTLRVTSSSFIGYLNYVGDCEYFHDQNNKGTAEITFIDEENNIIAGTFNMTLINPDCASKQTLIITKGRFDFGY